LTARIPEFDRLTKVELFKVDEEIRKSIRKLTSDAKFKFHLPSFTIEEVNDFIKLYSPVTDEVVINKKSREIYSRSGGDPIMVRFFTIGQGLREDVEEKYNRYLQSQLEMKTMLVCSLLDISSVKITSNILEKCGVLKGAYALADATLSQDYENSWRTKHLRWDEEFLSMLSNEEDEAILLDRKQFLNDAIESIFNVKDKKITCAVIESLYNLSATGLIPISIVDDVVRIPKYLNKETKRNLFTFTIGPAYSGVKKYDKAITIFDDVLRTDPDYIIALYNKGLALSQAGRHNEAITCYNKALDIDPNFAEAWNNKGLALYVIGKNKIHDSYYASCFDRALKIDPLCSPAWLNKGNTQFDLSKYQDAIERYNKALDIDPNYVEAWNNKGLALHYLGRYDDAIECYNKALNIDPNFVNALNGKGRALEELGKNDNAIECYDKALRLRLTIYQRADLWYRKGTVFHQVRRYIDAISCYDEALKVYPRADAWNNKGNIYLNADRYDDAIECYDKALEIDDTDALTWYNKGFVLQELGKHGARQCYKEALRLNPHLTEELERKDFKFLSPKRYDSVLRNAKSRSK
jgi:tetratricopeptide (TPR) repeat protein